MNLNRRSALVKFGQGAIALTAGGTHFASRAAAEFTLKYGNYHPLSHPNNIYAEPMAKKIREESGGRIDFQIYPNSQLGSDTDMLSQLRSGALDFMSLGPTTLGTLLPPQQVSGLGFAFKDYDTLWAAMDGKLGLSLRTRLAAATPIFAFEKIWDNGYRQITTSSKPIERAENLQGLRLRVPPAPLLTSMFRALGASPTTITMHEVYPSLQTHVVEGQENPLVLINASKLYEVQKYCALTDHSWEGFWMLGNKSAFAKLPVDLQEVVTRNINTAALEQRKEVERLNSTLVGDLSKSGMKFNTPDRNSFRSKLQESGFYTEWRKKVGEESWKALEEFTGPLA